MKIKLFFAIINLNKGGAEISLINLLNNLNPNQYDVDLLIMDQRQNFINLIDRIPTWIRVCDAYKKFIKMSILTRIHGKFIYTKHEKWTFPKS